MTSTTLMNKAVSAFKKQEPQHQGTKAMVEYLANQLAEQKKTEKLRALRLAREASITAAAQQVVPPKGAPTRREKARSKRVA